MTKHDSTSQLTRDEALDLLTDMLKQAESDKATLREALEAALYKLETARPEAAASIIRAAIEEVS